jgi:uncharacterized membrane protein HdeD (DUF308 family)
MIKMLYRSIAVGAVAAIVLGVLAFAFPFFDAFSVYIAPFGLLAPILDRIPGTLINQLNGLLPDDGPAAGVAVILGTVLGFWTAIFGALYFAWIARRQKRAIHANDRPTR